MGHTFAVNRVHIVFSTKNRRKQIPPDLQPRLWAYMGSIAKNRHMDVPTIGGMDDHVHIVLTLPPTIALAKAMQEIKAISSKWMRDTGHRDFGWQDGYAAFSVSESRLADVIEYVRTQPQHHQKHTFEAEFISLLKKHGVAYDPKYVLG